MEGGAASQIPKIPEVQTTSAPQPFVPSFLCPTAIARPIMLGIRQIRVSLRLRRPTGGRYRLSSIATPPKVTDTSTRPVLLLNIDNVVIAPSYLDLDEVKERYWPDAVEVKQLFVQAFDGEDGADKDEEEEEEEEEGGEGEEGDGEDGEDDDDEDDDEEEEDEEDDEEQDDDGDEDGEDDDDSDDGEDEFEDVDVIYSPTVIQKINEWSAVADIIWVSSWQEKATELLAPALGLKDFPVLPKHLDRATKKLMPSSAYAHFDWKVNRAQRMADFMMSPDRLLVWLDDELDCSLNAVKVDGMKQITWDKWVDAGYRPVGQDILARPNTVYVAPREMLLPEHLALVDKYLQAPELAKGLSVYEIEQFSKNKREPDVFRFADGQATKEAQTQALEGHQE